MNKTIEQTNEQSMNNFFDDIGTTPMTRIPYVKRLLFLLVEVAESFPEQTASSVGHE